MARSSLSWGVSIVTSCSSSLSCGLLASGLLEHLHHGFLQSLSLEQKAVLVPDKVWLSKIERVTLHTSLKQADNVAVVRLSFEGQTSAVVHEFLELVRVVQAELVKGHFLLLALDGVVLLLLGAAWKTLPRETTAQKVKDHVSNGLQIITARLLVANMGVDGGVTRSTGEILAVSEGDVLSL